MNIINEKLVYKNMIEITYDNNGDIQTMQVNSPLLNSVSQKIVIEAQKALSQTSNLGVDIPLGSLSGIIFLSGKGPDLTLKAYPVGSLNYNYKSTFTTAGINQTNHRVKMLITSNIKVILPCKIESFQIVTEVLLFENIIIGKVPDTYLQSNSLDEMLNLIP